MPGATIVGMPATVHWLSGNDTFVVEMTVKEPAGLLVKENWNAPLANILAPVSKGGVIMPAWLMAILTPNKLM